MLKPEKRHRLGLLDADSHAQLTLAAGTSFYACQYGCPSYRFHLAQISWHFAGATRRVGLMGTILRSLVHGLALSVRSRATLQALSDQILLGPKGPVRNRRRCVTHSAISIAHLRSFTSL